MALDFLLSLQDPATADHDCVVVGVFADNSLTDAAKAVDGATQGRLAALVARGDVSGKTGRTTLLQDLPGLSSPRLLVVGLGEREKFAAPQFLKAIGDATRALRVGPVKAALLTLTQVPVIGRDLAWNVRQAAIATDHAVYEYTTTRSKAAEVTLASVTLLADAALETELQRGIAIAAGVAFAREQGNLPPNICNPIHLAEQAMLLSARYDNVTCEALDRPAMEALGMGSLLAVSRGSANPPRLIVLRYTGAADAAPFALVAAIGVGSAVAVAGHVAVGGCRAADRPAHGPCPGSSGRRGRGT